MLTWNDEQLWTYWLGAMPAVERERLEEQSCAGDELFEQMQMAERELADAYVREELTPAQQAQFETHYLALPRSRERVEFARALRRQLHPAIVPVMAPVAAAPRESWFARWREKWATWFSAPQLAWALVLLVCVAAGVWWYRNTRPTEIAQHNGNAPTPLPALPPATPAAAPPPLEATPVIPAPPKALATPPPRAPVATPPPAPRPTPAPKGTPPAPPQPEAKPVIATFLLLPGVVRNIGAPPQTITLEPKTTDVRLNLPLSEVAYRAYQIELQNAEGQVLHRLRVTPPTNKANPVLTFTAPARKLPAGDFVIRVYGASPDGPAPVNEYTFHVERSKTPEKK